MSEGDTITLLRRILQGRIIVDGALSRINLVLSQEVIVELEDELVFLIILLIELSVFGSLFFIHSVTNSSNES